MDTTTLLVTGLVLLLIYRRATRLMGFQKHRPVRMVIRLVLLSALGVVKLGLSVVSPLGLVADLAGIGIGAALAWQAARHVVFERRPDAWYYKTNPWIGAAVFGLFMLRFAWRGARLYSLSADPTAGLPASGPFDGLTSVLFLIFVAYQVGFTGYVWNHLRSPPADPG